MDQVLSLMSRQTIRFGEEDALTAAMVNNYIKDGVVPRAEGKRYHAEHLAYLTMVCVLKQVLAVKDAALLTGSAMENRLSLIHIYTRTEKLIEKGMDRLMAGRTVFVIAHRLSTVRNSQAIMVLEQGLSLIHI